MKTFKTESEAQRHFGDPDKTGAEIWQCDLCGEHSIIDAYEDGGIMYTGGGRLTDKEGSEHGYIVCCADCDEEYGMVHHC